MVAVQGVEHGVLHGLANLRMAVNFMVTIHQYLRFHNRYQSFGLTDGRVASQHFGIGLDTVQAGGLFVDAVDLAPFREAGALLFIATQALRKSIQSLGDEVAG